MSKTAGLTRTLGLLRSSKGKLVASIGLLSISSAITLSIPYGVGVAIDMLPSPEGFAKIQNNVPMITSVFFLGAAANAGRVYLFNMVCVELVARLRNRLYSSLLLKPARFHDTHPSAEMVSRISSDAQLVGNSLTTNVSDGLRSFAGSAASLGMMIKLSPPLTASVFGALPVMAVMAFAYGRTVKRATQRTQAALADASQSANERLAGIRTVKIFGREWDEQLRFANHISLWAKHSHVEAIAKAAFFGTSGLAGNLIILSTLWFGGKLMMQGALSVGELSSFLMYTAYFGVNAVSLGSTYGELMKASAGVQRIVEISDPESLFNTSVANQDAPALDALHASDPASLAAPASTSSISSSSSSDVSFHNVSFAYPSSSSSALHNSSMLLNKLSFTAKPNQLLCIVGASGSGKSTITHLLSGLYEPIAGQIKIGGVSLSDMTISQLRSTVCVVSQDSTLFSGSIAENIAYGLPLSDTSASTPSQVQERIINAAKSANAHDFILKLENAYDYQVGERGSALSGGQRQRVCIARAILRNTPVIVMDEITSALDSRAESLVQDTISSHLIKDRIVIMIAHRPSTIQRADHILVLNEGAIVQSGSYHELSNAHGGAFRNLMASLPTVPPS